ncbi:Stf0 family sulfotransferase [Dactylosporangium sp. NPDC051484]|uniref:Stf0 family sulfotransferase n=1 Tax=Dactylosporangium sp. NPDC051484 TaxID=3154942 RepID=UPI00344FF33B
MESIDAYFVCGTPRTGSSLLLGLLGSTGVAGRPQAYFREPDEQLWAERWGLPGDWSYDDFVCAAIEAGRTPNGVFGAKLMWGTLDRLAAGLATVYPTLAGRDLDLLERAFGRVRFIWVYREDTLAQAVSWVRAEQTNVWYIGGNGEIGDTGPSGRAPAYDTDRLAELTKTIEEHDAAWGDWFRHVSVEPFRLRYEDLAADKVRATEEILAYLGLTLPVNGRISEMHARQADPLNREWIERFRAGAGPR